MKSGRLTKAGLWDRGNQLESLLLSCVNQLRKEPVLWIGLLDKMVL